MGGLINHEYSLPLDETAIDEAREQAKRCIENFILSDTFKDIKSVPVTDWFFCPPYNEYRVNDIKVWAMYDFAYIKDGILHILDFKTGKSRDSEKNIQSLGYVFYFVKEKGFDLNKVQFIFYHLYPDKTDLCDFSQQDIVKMEEKIQKDYVIMESLLKDPKNYIAEVENFPKTPDLQKCRYCQFRRYCDTQN